MQTTEANEGPYIGDKPMRAILAGVPPVDRWEQLRLAQLRALTAFCEAYGARGDTDAGVTRALEDVLAMVLELEQDCGVEHGLRERLLLRLLTAKSVQR